MKVFLKNKKFLKYIVTMQEAYSAIIPYFILLSFLTLLKFFIEYFAISLPLISLESLKHLIILLEKGASIVITIAIAYFLSIRLKICQTIAMILSVATLFSIVYLKTLSLPLELPLNFSPLALLNPIVSTLFLYLFYPFFTLNLPETDENRHIYKFFNYIFVFIVAYLMTILFYIVIDIVLETFLDYIRHLQVAVPDFLHYLLRDFLIQTYWFFGIHGSHTVNALFGKALLGHTIFENLTYGDFNRLFVVIGGAGSGIALLLAMLLHIQDRSYKLLTKISIPFVIFNINTLLIYAIIVFNRFLLIPFIFLPLMNILIAYGALHFLDITFLDHKLVWMTPVFIDSYIKTGGSLSIWFLQIFLIAIDTLVYSYFIKRFERAKTFESKAYRLKKNLEIEEEIRSKMYVKAYMAHKEIIEADAQLEKVLRNLRTNNLYLYFQPKILLKDLTCNKFEALLRFEKDGQIVGPIFLDTIEKAGLAPIIDIWVVKEVKKSLDAWKKEDFFPQISVNLHPDTIQSNDAITKIIEILEGENVIFEIVERSFLDGKNAQDNLERLRAKKFGIAIDDFGIGYSSLETLVKLHIDELKFDKSIIDIVHTKKGEIICKNITILCHQIGVKVVAEGVEQKEQVEILKEMKVDFIQGFYFSKALPFEKIVPFVKGCESLRS